MHRRTEQNLIVSGNEGGVIRPAESCGDLREEQSHDPALEDRWFKHSHIAVRSAGLRAWGSLRHMPGVPRLVPSQSAVIADQWHTYERCSHHTVAGRLRFLTGFPSFAITTTCSGDGPKLPQYVDKHQRMSRVGVRVFRANTIGTFSDLHCSARYEKALGRTSS